MSEQFEQTEDVADITTTQPPKVVRLAEELACKLNPVEWGSKAQELSDALQSVTEVTQRKVALMGQINAELKTANARASKLANIVSTHTEYREVTVEVKYDYDTGKVTRTRTDINEVISEREMTDSERQLELVQDADSFIEENRKAERAADAKAKAEGITEAASTVKNNRHPQTKAEADDMLDAGEIEDIDEEDLA